MSGGLSCKCSKSWDDKVKNWIVEDYKCNYSIFGYPGKKKSDYSQLSCNKCLATWRTKAGYVDKLYREHGGIR